MNNQKAKLFRPLFKTRQSFRQFKKAYAGRDLATRLKTIEVAKRTKGKEIHHAD